MSNGKDASVVPPGSFSAPCIVIHAGQSGALACFVLVARGHVVVLSTSPFSSGQHLRPLLHCHCTPPTTHCSAYVRSGLYSFDAVLFFRRFAMDGQFMPYSPGLLPPNTPQPPTPVQPAPQQVQQLQQQNTGAAQNQVQFF